MFCVGERAAANESIYEGSQRISRTAVGSSADDRPQPSVKEERFLDIRAQIRRSDRTKGPAEL